MKMEASLITIASKMFRSAPAGAFLFCIALLGGLFPWPVGAADDEAGVPLIVGHRTVHVFRAPFGAFSPADRAEGARKRIEQAFAQPGEGWTSIKPGEPGIAVDLDGRTLFYVVPEDARPLTGETAEGLANAASRVLQKAWSEARERRDTRANLWALGKVALATLLLALTLVAMARLSARLRCALLRWMTRRMGASSCHAGRRLAQILPTLAARLLVLLTWLLGLFLVFLHLTYSLGQFVLTRPAAERLSESIAALAANGISAMAASIPGLFISIMIFLLAWIAARISTELFAGVEAAPSENAMLNRHTAPTTRRIVNALIWLFAIAMAYPYLPGSHTEAFKGLSVIVGIMVSIGAAGVVGQIASGVMIVYTYALKQGEYVRIQEHEGTVSELGLFVTRLRTGLGEEISLPNTFVLANVTRNYSRLQEDGGYVLDISVTIGYDVPWRQVHAMLLEAACGIQEILAAPPAYVMQTALSDFYVAYRLVAHVDADAPAVRARVASDLHAAIQDAFNRHGVQIMSPHYHGDPDSPKLVPEAKWFPPPAVRNGPDR